MIFRNKVLSQTINRNNIIIILLLIVLLKMICQSLCFHWWNRGFLIWVDQIYRVLLFRRYSRNNFAIGVSTCGGGFHPPSAKKPNRIIMNGGTSMSETINVRDKSYFEELAERERVRRSIQVMERQMEEQMKKSIPDAIDNLLSGVFKNQKMEFEIKL